MSVSCGCLASELLHPPSAMRRSLVLLRLDTLDEPLGLPLAVLLANVLTNLEAAAITPLLISVDVRPFDDDHPVGRLLAADPGGLVHTASDVLIAEAFHRRLHLGQEVFGVAIHVFDVDHGDEIDRRTACRM